MFFFRCRTLSNQTTISWSSSSYNSHGFELPVRSGSSQRISSSSGKDIWLLMPSSHVLRYFYSWYHESTFGFHFFFFFLFFLFSFFSFFMSRLAIRSSDCHIWDLSPVQFYVCTVQYMSFLVLVCIEIFRFCVVLICHNRDRNSRQIRNRDWFRLCCIIG